MLIFAIDWAAIGPLLFGLIGGGGLGGLVSARLTHHHERDQVIRDKMLLAGEQIGTQLADIVISIGRLDNEFDSALWADVERRRERVREIDSRIEEVYRASIRVRILYHPSSETAHQLRRVLAWSRDALRCINAMYDHRIVMPDPGGETLRDQRIRDENIAAEKAWHEQYLRSRTRSGAALRKFEDAIWQAIETPRRAWPERSRDISVGEGLGPGADIRGQLASEDRVDAVQTFRAISAAVDRPAPLPAAEIPTPSDGGAADRHA